MNRPGHPHADLGLMAVAFPPDAEGLIVERFDNGDLALHGWLDVPGGERFKDEVTAEVKRANDAGLLPPGAGLVVEAFEGAKAAAQLWPYTRHIPIVHDGADGCGGEMEIVDGPSSWACPVCQAEAHLILEQVQAGGTMIVVTGVTQP